MADSRYCCEEQKTPRTLILCENGDLITQQLSIMDICGADQTSASRKMTSTGKKRQGVMNKDDRTLEAIHGIVDTLSTSTKKHTPYRDAKITRLVCSKLNPNSNSYKYAFLRLDITDNASYDESCAIMEYYIKMC